jgi:hypothetical protein
MLYTYIILICVICVIWVRTYLLTKAYPKTIQNSLRYHSAGFSGRLEVSIQNSRGEYRHIPPLRQHALHPAQVGLHTHREHLGGEGGISMCMCQYVYVLVCVSMCMC